MKDRSIGSRVRERRMAMKMRQADLASRVGISASYLNLIEHDKRRIGGKLVVDIANVLGVTVSFFFEGLTMEPAPDDVASTVPDDLIGDKEAMELVRSYYAIPEAQRRRLFDLARVLSDVA